MWCVCMYVMCYIMYNVNKYFTKSSNITFLPYPGIIDISVLIVANLEKVQNLGLFLKLQLLLFHWPQ